MLFLVKHYRANIFLKLQLNFHNQLYEIFLDFVHLYQEDLKYRKLMKFQMRHQIYFELIVWIRLHVFFRERDVKKSE